MPLALVATASVLPRLCDPTDFINPFMPLAQVALVCAAFLTIEILVLARVLALTRPWPPLRIALQVMRGATALGLLAVFALWLWLFSWERTFVPWCAPLNRGFYDPQAEAAARAPTFLPSALWLTTWLMALGLIVALSAWRSGRRAYDHTSAPTHALAPQARALILGALAVAAVGASVWAAKIGLVNEETLLRSAGLITRFQQELMFTFAVALAAVGASLAALWGVQRKQWRWWLPLLVTLPLLVRIMSWSPGGASGFVDSVATYLREDWRPTYQTIAVSRVAIPLLVALLTLAYGVALYRSGRPTTPVVSPPVAAG